MSARGADPAAVEVWDAHAARYARQEPLEAAAVATLVRLAEPGARDVVVDVGTGTGIVPVALAALDEEHRPSHVLALDRSERMLARVPSLPAGYEVERADATALPVRTGSAELVTCAYLLQILGPVARADALAEMRRVLAPGGRVVVCTPWSPRPLVRRALDALAGALPARLGGLRTLDPEPDLHAAGLVPRRRAHVHRGYPSVVVEAVTEDPATAIA